MKTIRNIALFLTLAFFLACQNPYKKEEKEPMKIGIVQHTPDGEDEVEDESEKMSETETLDEKGIGPIEEVELDDDVDQDMADAGEELFEATCVACHQVDSKMIGPPMKGVLDRRSPEWVMNMILNTDEMLDKDEVASALLEEFGSPMTYMGTSEEEAREILEWMRTL